ncbi:MAG: hypothetical protein EOP48_09000 [Sphingobacteriales bacterium]|nr:MAG: hypothetical protein EOP48_09000 [Sphingobacteriales bacterium]
MNFPNLLALTAFVALLLFGPINHDWPAYFLIRLGYLILVPGILWLLSRRILRSLSVSKAKEKLLERTLFAMIALTFLTFAILTALQKNHVGNTKYVRYADGVEPVGDDILVAGADWGSVYVLLGLATVTFIVGVVRNKTTTDARRFSRRK